MHSSNVISIAMDLEWFIGGKDCEITLHMCSFIPSSMVDLEALNPRRYTPKRRMVMHAWEDGGIMKSYSKDKDFTNRDCHDED